MSSMFRRSRLAAASFPLACAPAVAAPLAGIVQAEDGRPVAGALVVAAGSDAPYDANDEQHHWIATSDAAGRFAFADFNASDCQVTANAGAAGLGHANCKPANGIAAAEVVVTVKPAAASARGRVVWPAATPHTPDAVVLLTSETSTEDAPEVYGARIAGDAWSTPIVAGAWSVVAVTPQVASGTFHLRVPARNRPLTLDLAHPKGTNPALAHELAAMFAKDQEVRRAFLASGSQDFYNYKPARDVDAANLARIRQIVRQHGWPTAAQVGSAGMRHVFMIIQHEPEFIPQALPHLRAAADRGELSAATLALMIDRNQTEHDPSLPQTYGTQLVAQDGHWVPLPIRDPAHVDERRAQVGLGPLAETIAKFEKSSPIPGAGH